MRHLKVVFASVCLCKVSGRGFDRIGTNPYPLLFGRPVRNSISEESSRQCFLLRLGLKLFNSLRNLSGASRGLHRIHDSKGPIFQGEAESIRGSGAPGGGSHSSPRTDLIESADF